MSVKRVPPKEASDLLQKGYRYVDVRSVPEYEAGHVPGSLNVPLMHFLPGRGMVPNPEFTEVFARIFGKTEKLVIGCKSGGRSLRAAEMMSAQGWTDLIDMAGGFEGDGTIVGWRPAGLPVEKETPAEAGWEALKTKK